MFRVASIQMTSSEKVVENLTNAQALIQQAADAGAKLVVLPEMFAIMGTDQYDKVKVSEPAGSGHIQDFLAEMAAKYQVWIIGGTVPIAASDPEKIRAACLVYDARGKQVARYDKIKLFDAKVIPGKEEYRESKTTEPGDEIVVVDTPFAKLGLAVCFDVRFPELFRTMLARGVEIIALPAAFTFTTGQAHWDILVRARAIENFSYVIAACQTGTHNNGRKTYGNSMIVNPWGGVIASVPVDVGVAVADIDLAYLKQVRDSFAI